MTLDSLGIKNLKDIAAPAKKEYARFMSENANKKIPSSGVLPIYRKKNVRTLSKQLRADNPDTLGKMPLNSVGFLQKLKSTAAARGRSLSEKAPEWREASKAIKGAIDKNFSGFKELNTKFAKSVEADDIAKKIANPDTREDSNVASMLLRTGNIEKLEKSFGKEKASKLLNALRGEKEAHKNLVSVSSKARNRAQSRGSINVGAGNIQNVVRNLGYVGAGAFNPLLGVGLAATDYGIQKGAKKLSESAARRLLQGGTDAKISPVLRAIGAQQLGRQIGD